MSRKCPVCNISLQLTTPLAINQLVVCPNCGLELEVVWLYPLELVKVSSWNDDQRKMQKIPKRLNNG